MKVWELKFFKKNLSGMGERGEDTIQDVRGTDCGDGDVRKKHRIVSVVLLPFFFSAVTSYSNGQVTSLFHRRNPPQYLFLSKRGKLSVLKWLFSIWLGERHCPSAWWVFYFHLNFCWHRTLLNTRANWKPRPWHSILLLLASIWHQEGFKKFSSQTALEKYFHSGI